MKTLLFSLLALIGLVACSSQTQSDSLRRVSQKEFKKALTENPTCQLVDVRTPKEYRNGKIPNAQNIDFLAGDFDVKIQKLDKNKLTLLYCQAGGRSTKALSKMRKFGFKSVLELEGGYGKWQ